MAMPYESGVFRATGALRSNGGSQRPFKRLLVLAGSLPYPPTNGYRIRVWHLLRALKAWGCEVHLLAFGRQAELAAHEEAILAVCSTAETVSGDVPSLSGRAGYLGRLTNLTSRLPYGAARFKSRDMAARAGAWLGNGGVDAVLCEEPFLTVNLPPSLPVPLIMDSHNVEHVIITRYLALESNIARRAYAALEAKRLLRFERLCWERSDLILACSEYDSRTIAAICPGSRVHAVPNVIDVGSYPVCPDAEGRTLLYTGGMDWYPNRDAVAFFASAILPELRLRVPGVKLVVAGREPPLEFRQRFKEAAEVEFIGNVADMRAEIAKACVCVVPLRIGSGTRLKILEAAAMGKPIVSTRIGAEGLDFVPGTEILLADEPREFATAVASLLANRGLRDSMGQAARCRVEKQYSLPALREALRPVFEVPAQSRRVGS